MIHALPAGLHLHHKHISTSTNDDCLSLARSGAPDGTLVLADAQSAGRGREGRSWYSQPGESLCFSLLLRPNPAESACITRFSALGTLALIAALKDDYQLTARLKWPNDVLLAGKKVSGILVEIDWQEGLPAAMVVGMGVNIGKAAVQNASTMLYPPTSLEDSLTYKPERWSLLASILEKLVAQRQIVTTDAFIAECNAALAFKGEWAQLREQTGKIEPYRVIEMQQDAALLVESADGKMRKLYSGEFPG